MPTRQEALELLKEWVKSESLRKHCLAVAIAMESYAEKYNENKEEWYICGLLHDFDYEKFPALEQHTIEGARILRDKGYSEHIIAAILSHNEINKLKKYGYMAKVLFAVDELCGLLMALAKVKPANFQTMTPESVEKALKKKGFAAAISREDIERGIQELGVDRKEHFMIVIGALKKRAGELGF